jgi:hypothetical protein
MDIFGATMSRKRFLLILRAIRFDDKDTRQKRQETDRLAAIRNVADTFAKNCRTTFYPFPHLCVDERMVSYRGQVKFRVYMPNKPDKYGIKIFMLADSMNRYVMNLQIYLGKEGNKPEKEQGKRIVLDLVKDCVSSGHNITPDNFFASYSLGQELLKNKITILGTIRKNRKEVPASFSTYKNRELFSSLFAFTRDTTLVSYVAKKSKVVTLHSTMHHDAAVDEGHKKKPAMILDYNKTKIGVDVIDQMMKQYTSKRATRRWPLAIFLQFH